MKPFIFILTFCALHIVCAAQRIAAMTSADAAYDKAVAFYNASFGPELRIFNGKEYQEYRESFKEGHPYFVTNAFSKGTLHYEGSKYEDVSLLYNLVTDQLIILNAAGSAKIQLIKERVDSFSFPAHSFINIGTDSSLSEGLSSGFYEVLSTGKINLLARHTKNIQATVRDVVETKVFSKDHHFVRSNHVYIEINSKKALLKQMNDKRKELQQFIKQNKLNYRKNGEEAMVKIVEYYNQITKER